MLNLYDADGLTVKLGERIGSGGEGAVYAIQGKSGHWAAKIFHERPSTEKREKLGDMVKGWNENLKRIAAWPLSTLHEWNSGPVCGFIMPRVLDCRPIHQLYSPFQRKQLYPERDWAFLVSTARNVAAAFETVHAHGHVIGDVNPNLVLVAADSQVNLIDCDSFQIAANGKHYLCEVAVPHFTPPELQGHCGFSGVLRTVNHDNFGLALLLFHLLLMGRHPYAGLYPDLPDLSLEAAIQQFRYAYSHDRGLRKVQAPPTGLTPGVLPGQLAWMFIQAFTESGIQSPGRPAAQEWVQALDGLLKAIKPCTEDQAHRYFNGLPACPWCAHTEKFGNVFFIPRPPVSAVKAAPAYSTPAMHNVLDESSRAKSAAAAQVRKVKFPWSAVGLLLFLIFGAFINTEVNHSLDSPAKPTSRQATTQPRAWSCRRQLHYPLPIRVLWGRSNPTVRPAIWPIPSRIIRKSLLREDGRAKSCCG